MNTLQVINKQSLIERRRLPMPQYPGDVIALASKAKQVLGYQPLETRIEDVKTLHALAQVLDELDIDILDSASVERYKQAMLKDTTRTRDRWTQFLTWAIGAMGLLLLGNLAYILLSPSSGPWVKVLFPLSLVGATISFLALLCLPIPGLAWEWRCYLLKIYKQPIPTHVLEKAVAIKQRVPSLTLFIDELAQEERVADPFLHTCIGGKTIYLDVWAEPKFQDGSY